MSNQPAITNINEEQKMAQNAVVEREGNRTAVEVKTPETAAIFSIISKLAEQPNVDLDRMERLISMRDKEMERIARGEFNSAMASAQAEMPQVVKNAENNHTKSKYATYEAVSAAMQPIIKKHGFSLTFSEGKSEMPNCIKIVCVVSLGEYEKFYEAHVPIDNGGMKGNSNKNATQAFGSTITYGRRYLKTMIFDVSVKDEDDDAQSATLHETLTEEQCKEILGLIADTNSDIQGFCNTYGVGSVRELPSNMFNAAKQILVARKARQRADREQSNADSH